MLSLGGPLTLETVYHGKMHVKEYIKYNYIAVKTNSRRGLASSLRSLTLQINIY